jgi:hypothetical protein
MALCAAPQACGGVAETGSHSGAANEGGTGGSSGSGGPASDGGAAPISEIGYGGWENGGVPGSTSAGGASTGGLQDYSLSGGRVGFSTGGGSPAFVDSGAVCPDVFSTMSWPDRCLPSDSCIQLDSGLLPPSGGGDGPPDGAVAAETTVAESAFCAPPSRTQRYLFAFEESGASYDDFNVVTGDKPCEGRSLAFLGIGGVGDAPLTPVRTHCFSVPGSVLGNRLAIVALDPSAHIANLRAVSTCPCAYAIPYNVSSCPGVNGGGGHPNCG